LFRRSFVLPGERAEEWEISMCWFAANQAEFACQDSTERKSAMERKAAHRRKTRRAATYFKGKGSGF